MTQIFLDLVRLDHLPDGDDERWDRWLSAAELAACRPLARAADHLAARWAAKWALCAALGLSGPPIWSEIEVSRRPFGPPVVQLHGQTALAARRRQVVPRVSLSHAAGQAVALAWLSKTP